MSIDAPILFLVFNRYHTTIQVFETIRQEKPKKLYIAADGPRDNVDDDLTKCLKVRAIFEEIDWECEVFTLFQNNNLGPMKSQMTAINWFFENENEGIILEDDSLPDKTFYMFCYLLLDKYRNDERISMISGCNFQQQNKYGDEDYYFSKYTNTCGWATWRSSWDHVDVYLTDWPDFLDTGVLEDISSLIGVRRKLKEVFENIYLNPDSRGWDYRFMYSSLKNGAVSIVPNVNLIKNIGFGPGATNTFNNNSPQSMLEIYSMNFPLKHPCIVSRNLIADEFEGFNNHYKRNFIEKVMFYSFAWKELFKILKIKYYGGNK